MRREFESFERNESGLISLKARVEAAALADDNEQYAVLSSQLKKSYSVAFEEMAKLRHAVALAKAPKVIEHLICTLESTDKVLCFAHHRDVVEKIAAAFPGEAVILYGGMADKEKDEAVQAFQNDPKIRLFVGGITAAGVGLTLTAAAHVVMAELDWRPGIVTQAEDRTHRIGQTEPVLVQHLVLEGSLDARMVKFIVRKQNIIDQALDKGAAMVAGAVPVLTVEIGSVIDSEKAEKQAPPASDELRTLVHSGLRQLAGMDQDHAMEINGVGFNKFDGAFGHALASYSRLSDKMVAAGIKLCVKYRGQLGEQFSEALEELISC